jgi:hypothetical protein
VATDVPLSATQTTPFGLNAMPHAFFRFASVCGAGTAPSETSAVALNDWTLTDPPPHATRVAKAAPPAMILNTLSRDFMTALLT